MENYKEGWLFLIRPSIVGKSGKSHQFDYGFFMPGKETSLILCKRFSSEIRNGLAALTLFNAHCEDVGAFRKTIVCEKGLTNEETLLASALKIEILGSLEEMNEFLGNSMKEITDVMVRRLDISSILSGKKDEHMERSKKKYRDRTKLIQEVLRSASAQDGATLNNIVFKCNLNYNSARKIVDDLIGRELIRIEKDQDDKVVYRTTGDGSRLIEKLRGMDGPGIPDEYYG